jgi:hypothetical protein
MEKEYEYRMVIFVHFQQLPRIRVLRLVAGSTVVIGIPLILNAFSVIAHSEQY